MGRSAADRYRVVPAAYVIFRRRRAGKEQVLLQLRRNTGFRDGFWAVAAAGHVEDGESVLAAACREAAEELGVTVRPADLRPLTAMHRTQATGDPIDERVDFFFACDHWDGEPRLLEPHKTGGLDWFDLSALPDPVVPHELAILSSLSDGTAPPPITAFGF